MANGKPDGEIDNSKTPVRFNCARSKFFPERKIIMSKIYTSADQLIGHTPLLELTNIEKAEHLEATILAKL